MEIRLRTRALVAGLSAGMLAPAASHAGDLLHKKRVVVAGPVVPIGAAPAVANTYVMNAPAVQQAPAVVYGQAPAVYQINATASAPAVGNAPTVTVLNAPGTAVGSAPTAPGGILSGNLRQAFIEDLKKIRNKPGNTIRTVREEGAAAYKEYVGNEDELDNGQKRDLEALIDAAYGDDSSALTGGVLTTGVVAPGLVGYPTGHHGHLGHHGHPAATALAPVAYPYPYAYAPAAAPAPQLYLVPLGPAPKHGWIKKKF